MIQADNLWKKFGRHEALRGLSFTVPEGSAFALIGANGAGKTTTIKILMNILSATRGAATLLGVDSRRISPRELSRIGYVSENQDMPEGLTVAQYLDYLRPFYPKWDRDLEIAIRRDLRLPPDRKIGDLSHGMRMKMSLACALPLHPKLLVLDEPFSGLDPFHHAGAGHARCPGLRKDEDMIWHIFKKDLRLLWPFASAVAAVGWLCTVLVYHNDHSNFVARPMFNLLVVLQLMSSGILTANAVQLDALPGVRQDWLIRPIRRREQLFAKLLFVVVMVQAPIFIADLVAVLADGFPLGQSRSAALLRSLSYFTAFLVPSLAFASITRNFTEAIVAVVATGVTFMGLIQATNLELPLHWRLSGITGTEWVVALAVLVVSVLGVAAILSLQYFRRRTVAARWLTAAVTLLCVLVNFAPWQPVFAIQQRVSPQPGAASQVRLEFQSGLGRYREPSGAGYIYQRHSREEGTAIYLPVGILGLPPNSILRTNLLLARLVDPSGRTFDLDFASAPLFRNDAAQSDDATHHMVFVRDALYARFRNSPVRLELDYSLTLLHLYDAHAIPAINGRQTVPELGQCTTDLNNSRTSVQLRCLQVGGTPACASFFLEHRPSGKRNPEIVRCEGDYTPFFLQTAPDAFRRPNVNLQFRDAGDRWHLPVDGPQLRDSQVVTRFYQPLEHFSRHVAIQDVRLSDWLPM